MLIKDIAHKGEQQKKAYRNPSGFNSFYRDFQEKKADYKKDYSVCLQAAQSRDEDYKKNIKENLYLREQGLS
jgi:hypothetical protein